jgi:hypothetical protein
MQEGIAGTIPVRVQILESAFADIANGALFYELQRMGLGRRFAEGLAGDMEKLRLHAGIHPVILGYHRMLAKRFPYAVYYRIHADLVQVHAVLDCRRDPKWVERRLQERG